jgi:hypothetical protein
MNKKNNKGVKRNDTPTPLWLCNFLYELVKQRDIKTILEPHYFINL